MVSTCFSSGKTVDLANAVFVLLGSQVKSSDQ